MALCNTPRVLSPMPAAVQLWRDQRKTFNNQAWPASSALIPGERTTHASFPASLRHIWHFHAVRPCCCCCCQRACVHLVCRRDGTSASTDGDSFRTHGAPPSSAVTFVLRFRGSRESGESGGVLSCEPQQPSAAQPPKDAPHLISHFLRAFVLVLL